ncbi:MAG: glycosyltransferase family 4 protein [Candidatus Cyclobacteriaceae bacterium M2_1C_046]
MNFLIIHQHFRYPDEGGAVRSYYLGQALLKAGHKVTVLSRKNFKKSKIKNIDALEVHYLPVSYSNKMSFPRRIISYLAFVLKAINYCRRKSFVSQFNYCYCISTPLTSGIIGYWLLKQKKVPYLFEVGDLWPDAPLAMGALNYPFAPHLAHFLEKSIYANSSGVIGLSPYIVSTIKQRTTRPVFYVPNFSDIDFFYKEKFIPPEPFIISYTGAIGRANGLEYFLNAALEAQRRELKVHFYLMGRGAAYEKLKIKVKDDGIKNIFFIPFGNKEEVKRVLTNSHAIYVSYRKLPVLETGSPNKFFDGLASGKLIILNFGGWLSDLTGKYSCGFNYDPEDPKDFIEKLSPLLRDMSKLKEAQHNALKLAREKFNLKDWEKTFVQIVEKQAKSDN